MFYESRRYIFELLLFWLCSKKRNIKETYKQELDQPTRNLGANDFNMDYVDIIITWCLCISTIS